MSDHLFYFFLISHLGLDTMEGRQYFISNRSRNIWSQPS